jgi:hypothetical protein
MRNTYIKINGKSLPVIFTRKSRENAVLNFQDNVLFVLETIESLVEDQKVIIRNPAFDYDLTVLVSSTTEEVVILNFTDINEKQKPDIVFSLNMLIA